MLMQRLRELQTLGSIRCVNTEENLLLLFNGRMQLGNAKCLQFLTFKCTELVSPFS